MEYDWQIVERHNNDSSTDIIVRTCDISDIGEELGTFLREIAELKIGERQAYDISYHISQMKNEDGRIYPDGSFEKMIKSSKDE